MSLLGYVEMSLIVFLLRIKKLEKETALILQCKRNGWTDLSGQLDQYEKVLGNGKHAESKSFYPLQHVSRFTFNEGQCFCVGVKLCLSGPLFYHFGVVFIWFFFRGSSSKSAFKDQD